MNRLPPPLAFLFLLFAGWVTRQQQDVIEYLLEENRILRAAHGFQRLRLTDDQRRRLAVKGKILGRRRLAEIAGIVTPDTILPVLIAPHAHQLGHHAACAAVPA
jgi:putative transposase